MVIRRQVRVLRSPSLPSEVPSRWTCAERASIHGRHFRGIRRIYSYVRCQVFRRPILICIPSSLPIRVGGLRSSLTRYRRRATRSIQLRLASFHLPAWQWAVGLACSKGTLRHRVAKSVPMHRIMRTECVTVRFLLCGLRQCFQGILIRLSWVRLSGFRRPYTST